MPAAAFVTARPSKRRWVWQILGSMVVFIAGMLCLVKAQREHAGLGNGGGSSSTVGLGEVANIVMAFASAALAVVVLLAWPSRRRAFADVVVRDPRSRRKVLPWLIAFGALFFAGNAAYFAGIVNAPNPGLAAALLTLEVAGLAAASAWVFGERLGWRQAAGIAVVIAGAVMVSI